MAITVYFYKTGKKINSTKQITQGVGDIGLSCELKDVTNLLTPTLIISANTFLDQNDSIKNPLDFVYCSIPDFNRKYFVRDWSWILGRWECSLEVDVLASFKTEVGNTTSYILRSASSYDGRVIDSKYPTKAEVKTLANSRGSIWETNLSSANISSGFYVLGIVNNDSGAIGATSYYAVNARGMRTFMASLYASPAWMNITDATISNDLQKMLINPIQYIVSCMWIPYALLNSSGLTQTTSIPVGWWTITINSNDPFYKLTGATLKESFSTYLDVQVHPQTTDAHLAWLKNAPYSQYQLQFYPFGVFPIDSAKLIGYDRIYCGVELDLITGIGTLTVTRAIGNSNRPTDILFSNNAQVGIPISLAQMSVDLSRLGNSTTWALSAGMALASDSDLQGAVKETVNAVSEAVTAKKKTGLSGFVQYLTNPEFRRNLSPETTQAAKEAVSNAGASLLSTVGQVAASVGNAVLASSGTCQVTGATGALAQFTLDHVLTLFYYELVDTDPVHYGYPLCQNAKINTLSGFVLCANDGDLSVSCSPVERQAIVALMQSGFYYE